MKAIAVAVALLLASAAQAQDAETFYRQGVEARLSGDPTRAAAQLREAVRLRPDNADAQLQLGLALIAANDLDGAEAAFHRTLALAPNYADAHIGLARVAQRRGDLAAARAALDPVDPANAEAAELRRLLAPTAEESRFGIDFDASYSALDKGQPDWREGVLRLTYRPDRETALSGAVQVANRFKSTDAYGELRIDHRISDAAAIYILAGGTPEAAFLPEWQIGAGASVRAANATRVTIDGRMAKYATGDIQTINPGVEQYLANGRVWLTGRWINSFDQNGDHVGGWLARGDWQVSDAFRIFAGAADAPDTSEGFVLEIFSLFGGVVWNVSDRHTLRASLAYEDRATGADRMEFALGVGVRF